MKRLRNGHVKAMYDYKKTASARYKHFSNFLQENGSIYIFNVEGFKIHKPTLAKSFLLLWKVTSNLKSIQTWIG